MLRQIQPSKKEVILPLKKQVFSGQTIATPEVQSSNKALDNFFMFGQSNAPLTLAAENGHVEVLKLLLNYAYENEFVKEGDDPAFDFIFQMEKEVDSSKWLTEDGWWHQALQGASSEGHVEIVELLLKCVQGTNIPKFIFEESFHDAVWRGHEKVVNVLLTFAKDRAIDAEVVLNGNTRSHSRIQQRSKMSEKDERSKQILNLLVKFAYDNIVGQDLLFRTTQEDNAPLHLENEDDHKRAIELLIECVQDNNSDPNILFGKFVMGITPLHLACRWGHIEVLQRLLQFANENNIGPSIVFSKRETGETPLDLACIKGHRQIVEILLQYANEKDVETNILFGKKISILYVIRDCGDENFIKRVLSFAYGRMIGHKIFYNAENSRQSIDSQSFHEEIIQRLINEEQLKPKILFEENVFGYTPLYVAVFLGHERVLQLLLGFAKDKNEINAAFLFKRYENKTPLCLASGYNRKEMVKSLLAFAKDKKMDPEEILELNGMYYDTPLCIATRTGNEEIVNMLLEFAKGTKVDFNKFFAKSTPLYRASLRGHGNIVKLLLKYAVDQRIKPEILFKTHFNETPLKSAFTGMSQTDGMKVVELLLKFAYEKNIDPNLLFPPMSYRDNYYFSKMVERTDLLIRFAYDKIMDEKRLFTETGKDQLDLRKEEDHVKAVQLIIEALERKGMEPEILFVKGLMGMNPLRVACLLNHAKVVKLLLDFANGNEIDCGKVFQENEEGNTPLHLAAKKGNESVVEEILNSFQWEEIHPILCKTNEDGRTVFQLAVELNREKIVELFQKFAKGKPSTSAASD